MTNPVSTQAHIDPKVLQQHNNKHIQTAQAPEKTEKGGVTVNDRVTIGSKTEVSATYSSSLTLDQNTGDGFDLLRGLVLNILKEQGIDFKIATGSETGPQEIDISQLTPEDAQALIADDGYFGVEQTSDRIVDFAIAMAGGDTSRLEAIKEGVDKGFNEALEAFGGWLPEISHKTYDAVMQKLDDWAKGVEDAQGS